MGWGDLAAVATLVSIPLGLIALWYAAGQLRTERAQHFPSVTVKRDQETYINLSVPDGTEFLIASVWPAWGLGTVTLVNKLGHHENGETHFEDAGSPTRRLTLQPPLSSVWLKTAISGSRPTLEIKIISDRFKSLTISKVL